MHNILQYDPFCFMMDGKACLSKRTAAQASSDLVLTDAWIVCGKVEAEIAFHRVSGQPLRVCVE